MDANLPDRDSPLQLNRPLRLAPSFSERPWGGTRLRGLLGKHAPPHARIGESWELSDHSHGLSSIADGAFAGLTFGALLRRHPRELIGRPHAPERHPLLVKFLDAEENLSVQVHPNDAWCLRARHADRGKSECWYILDCVPGAELVLGTLPGVTRERFREALAGGDAEALLRRVPIAPGCFVAVLPGTIHAILGGTLLCEVQQVSDTTFRLWDWNRQPARQLHIDHGMEVANFDGAPVEVRRIPPISPHGIVERGLLSNEYFRIRLFDVPPGAHAVLRIPSGKRTGWVACAVEGCGDWGRGDGRPIALGDSWFLPACLAEPIPLAAGPRGLRLLMAESLEL